MNNKTIKIKSKTSKPATISALVLLLAIVLISGVMGLSKPRVDNVVAANSYDNTTQLDWSLGFVEQGKLVTTGAAGNLTVSSWGKSAHFSFDSMTTETLDSLIFKDSYLRIGIFVTPSKAIPIHGVTVFLNYDENFFTFDVNTGFSSVRSGTNANTSLFKLDGCYNAGDGGVGTYRPGNYFVLVPDLANAATGNFTFPINQKSLIGIITLGVDWDDETIYNDEGDGFSQDILDNFYCGVSMDFLGDGDPRHSENEAWRSLDFPAVSGNFELYGKNSFTGFDIGDVPVASSAYLKKLSLKSATTPTATDHIPPASFDKDTLTYTASPDIAYSKRKGIKLGYEKESTSATVAVQVNTKTPISPFISDSVIDDLDEGSNTITVTVTDGGQTKIYTITANVTAGDTTNTLSGLTHSVGDLDQPFDPDIDTYILTIKYKNPSVDITATAASTLAGVKINGNPAASTVSSYTHTFGSVGSPIPTVAPYPTATIVVTPEKEGAAIKTYTVTIKREPVSVDAELSSVELTSPVPAYNFNISSGNYDYTANPGLLELQTSFKFKITKKNTQQKVDYRYEYSNNLGVWTPTTGLTTLSPKDSVLLDAEATINIASKGVNVHIEVTVTAEDGTTKQVYNFTVGRAPSSNTSLAAVSPPTYPVSITENSNTKNFTSTPYTYTLTASSTQITVDIKSTVGEKATVSLYAPGADVVNDAPIVSGSQSSAALSHNLTNLDSLADGSYEYTIKVTAQNGSDYATYPLTILKKSSNCTLTISSVKVLDADKGTDLSTGNITFNTGTGEYELTIPYKVNGNIIDNIRTEITGTPKSTISFIGGSGFIQGTNTVNAEPFWYRSTPFNGNKLQQSITSGTITVTAEDGLTSKTYSIKIIRQAASTDNTLKDLTVNGTTISGFGSATTDYPTAVVVARGTPTPAQLSVIGTANSADASVSYSVATVGASISSNGLLTFSGNGIEHVITITVTAESGAQKMYTVRVIAANTDKEMQNIELKDGADASLGLSFVKTTPVYNIDVAYGVTSVKLVVTAQDSEATAFASQVGASQSSYKRTVTLSVTNLSIGVTTFEVWVESDSKDKGQVYTINVTRKAAKSDKALNSLSVKDSGNKEYILSFSPTTFSYTVRVDRGINSLTVAAAVPGADGSKITNSNATSYSGIHNVSDGSSITVTITVIAENGVDKQDYTITINCKSDKNDITNIINDAKPSVVFDGSTGYNLLNLANTVSKINFIVALSPYAILYYQVNGGTPVSVNPSGFDITISGLPTGTTQTIKFYAVSENGVKSATEYTYSFTRNAVDTDATLSALSVKNGATELLTGFSSTNFNYSIRVDTSVTSVVVSATATKTATSTVNISPSSGTLTPNNSKTFTITVTAESGAKQDYTVIVYCASDNNTITDILIDGTSVGTLPVVAAGSTGTITITPNYLFSKKTITITATLADGTAVAYGVGVQNLADGTQYFEVYAISKYGSLLTPAHTKSDVPVYKLQITRSAANNDTTLKELIIINNNGGAEIKKFTNTSGAIGDVQTIYVPRSVTTIDISALANYTGANVSGIGAGLSLNTGGLRTFTVRVTGEDGVAYKDYTINIYALDNNNKINDITFTTTPAGAATVPAFVDSSTPVDLGTTAYNTTEFKFTVTLDNIYAKVYINGALASGATATRTYTYTLVDGLNTIAIYAVSEQGNQGTTYTYQITRTAASNNRRLKELVVTAGGTDLLRETNASGYIATSFTINVSRSVTSVHIDATADHAGAILTGDWDDDFALVPGTNTFTITVTAEDKTTRNYTITVIVKDDDSVINDITVSGSSFSSPAAFAKAIDTYTLAQVSADTASITFTITLNNQYAKVYVNGATATGPNTTRTYTVNLNPGLNTINIYAESERGTAGTTYKFTITRKVASSDANLEGLTVTDKDGNPIAGVGLDVTFSSSIQTYTVNLDKNSTLTELKLNATVTAPKTVSGDGVKTFSVKPDGTIDVTFTITVTAENGTTTKSYTVTIKKPTALSSDASISSAELKDSSNSSAPSLFTFKPLQQNQGSVTIPYSMLSGLDLVVTPTDSKASVAFSGTAINASGHITISGGATVTVYFQVVAEDGTTKSLNYYIEIKRENASADKYLQTLKVTSEDGTTVLLNLDRAVDGVISTTVNLRVDDKYDKIKIDATVPSGNGSKITSTIAASYSLTSGSITPIVITVQAQDNATETYTINIHRANNEAGLISITVDGQTIVVGDFTFVSGTTYKYDLPDVIYTKASVDISAQKVDSKATVTGTGNNIGLSVGANTLTISITAQDGKTTGNTYLINIRRLAQSGDDTLKELVVTDINGDLLRVTSAVASSYTLYVDRAITKVNISAVKNHEGSTVAGDIGTGLNVTAGTSTVFNIYVTAETGGTPKKYTVTVVAKDDNHKINDITFTTTPSGAVTAPAFADTTTPFNLGSTAYTTKEFNFTITIDNIYAKVYVNSVFVTAGSGTAILTYTYTLVDGLNKIEIYAESERGTKGTTYTYQITRTAADTNNKLSSLAIEDNIGTPLVFDEGSFDKDTLSYTITLSPASTATGVKISAAAESSYSVVSGAGTFGLPSTAGVINSSFTVTVTAQNGSKLEYKILVIRNAGTVASGDFTITTVSLKGKSTEYMTSFDPSVSQQTAITVPYAVDEVFLVVIPNHSKAIVKGGGAYSIAPGATKKITFWVEAENGTPSLTYYVDVTRDIGDADNKLTALYYEKSGTQVPLDVSQNIFYIDLPNTVGSIIIGGTAPAKATVDKFGTFTLTGVTSAWTIIVTSENGIPNTYVIIVTRKSDDALMKSILIDNVEHLLSFGAINEYTINIPYSKTNVVILAAANDTKATVTGNGIYNMNVGANTINIYATSEFGTQGIVYKLIINRAAADNDSYLFSLSVKDTATNGDLVLQPVFLSTTQVYTIDLTLFPAVSEIEIFATARSIYVNKIEGRGKFILKTAAGASSEIFTVTVTAEDGTTRKYDITVIRNVNPDDDVTIGYMALNGSDSENYLGTATNAKNQFSINTTTYNITVPFKVKNVTLTVTNPNGASVTGNGNYTLNTAGTTTVTFYLVSKSGNFTSSIYSIIITQETPSSDSKLSELKIDGVLVSGFNPAVTSYTVTVSLEAVTSVLISAKANNPEATLGGSLGTIGLAVGENTINITVRAEDSSQTTYTLTIKRLSFDNELKDLSVDGYVLDSLFNQSVSNYTLTVAYSVDKINILASANARATISGTGMKSLAVGSSNVFDVYAVSENNVKGKVYTITVTRTNASSDATLKTLKVYSGVDGQELMLSPAFNPAIDRYAIQISVDSGINSFDISATANSPYNKGVGGTGTKVLEALIDGKYFTYFEIVVMAENGTTKTYTVTVYRDVVLSDDLTISAFELVGSDEIKYLASNGGEKKFYTNIFSYDITVPYNVESLSLAMTANVATVYGNETKTFGTADELKFEVFLVSQSGIISEHYFITVTRVKGIGNNTLKEIKIDSVLIAGFDPNVTHYEINVPFSNSNSIFVSAAVTDPTATILGGTGAFTLSEGGNNICNISVRAQDGSTKIYTLVISYLNVNAFLETLTLSGSKDSIFSETDSENFPFEFNPQTNEYTIRISKETKSLNVKGTAQDQLGAAIVGLGKYTLADDENKKTITISVLSADKTTTKSYVLNIIREDRSSDSKLKSLEIAGYTVDFDPNRDEYKLYVKNNEINLDIIAKANSANAKVEIRDDGELRDGRNVIRIIVTAENGSTSTYLIIATKDAPPDYFLTILVIVVFAIWMLTLILLLLKRNRDKKKKEDEMDNYRFNDKKRNTNGIRR